MVEGSTGTEGSPLGLLGGSSLGLLDRLWDLRDLLGPPGISTGTARQLSLGLLDSSPLGLLDTLPGTARWSLHWDYPGISTGTTRGSPLDCSTSLHWDARQRSWRYRRSSLGLLEGSPLEVLEGSPLGLLDSTPLGLLDSAPLGLLGALHWDCSTALQRFIRRRRGQVWFRNTWRK
jgi:hypothetical protein